MKVLNQSKIQVIFFGVGAALLFLLGAAVWHAIIQADPPGCTENELACLFIPTRADYAIHLISYTLMTPFIAVFIFWFLDWKKQLAHVRRLTNNLATLAITDPAVEQIVARLGLTGKVIVADSDDFFSFCACSWSPRIFISRGVVKNLSGEELEALLLHEKWHLNNRDPLKVLVGHLTVSALFFGPVLKDLFQRYLVRMEIAADQFAIRSQGQKRGIALALQKLLDHQDDIHTATLAAAGTEALGHRINFILGRSAREPVPAGLIALSILVPALSLAAILLPLASLHF